MMPFKLTDECKELLRDIPKFVEMFDLYYRDLAYIAGAVLGVRPWDLIYNIPRLLREGRLYLDRETGQLCSVSTRRCVSLKELARVVEGYLYARRMLDRIARYLPRVCWEE